MMTLALLLIAAAQDEIPTQDLKADGDANKRYFLIGPKKDAAPPDEGWGLVLFMPGGDGSAEFQNFVKAIHRNSLAERYVAAQLVAVKWTPDQVVVWPTDKNRVAGMKFTTEQFVEAVIGEVGKKHKIDPRRVFTFSWSSGGPPAYAVSLQKKKLVTGSFIAMSVFKPEDLPPVAGAKGQAYYLYHSPEDTRTLFSFAEKARDELTKNGAKVELKTFEGGHAWKGNVHASIKAGFEWLEKSVEQKGK